MMLSCHQNNISVCCSKGSLRTIYFVVYCVVRFGGLGLGHVVTFKMIVLMLSLTTESMVASLTKKAMRY